LGADLKQADGYMFTEVACESPELARYRVKDFWNWHQNFERFREQFQAQFEQFENWLRSARMIENEEFLGAYYEKPADGSEEDLVLS
jgi:hypothetical protein